MSNGQAAGGFARAELRAELAPVIPVMPVVSVVDFDKDAFEERAAILEYDAGFSRDEAERRALALMSAENLTKPNIQAGAGLLWRLRPLGSTARHLPNLRLASVWSGRGRWRRIRARGAALRKIGR